MKVKVNSDICIGCGACEATCDKVFKVEDAVELLMEEVPEELEEQVEDAAAGCPVMAIEVEKDEEK